MGREKGYFRKGQSGNPGGKPKLPDDIRQARNMTKAEFISLASQFLKLTKEELTAKLNNPKTPALELLVASIIAKAVVHGDQKRTHFLLEWMFGKLKERMDLDVIQYTPHEQLLQLVEQVGKKEEG